MTRHTSSIESTVEWLDGWLPWVSSPTLTMEGRRQRVREALAQLDRWDAAIRLLRLRLEAQASELDEIDAMRAVADDA